MATPAILDSGRFGRPAPAEAADLSAEVARLQAEVAEVREQLLRAQQAESIRALAGGIAHDLNNVLAPILMSIGLLDEQITDAESRRVLGVLHESAQRGARMVQQILTLTRGATSPQATTPPRQLLEDLRRMIAETFPRSIDLMIEVASDVSDISAEPAHVRQILLKLCTAAREAMPSGGLLTLRAENIYVDGEQAAKLNGIKAGAFVMVSVSDSRATTLTDDRGSLLQRTAGFTTRSNDIGRGAAVRVYLPACPPAIDARTERDAHWPRGRNELILVVDDESSVRSITSQLLTAYGYRVLTASNGAEAVAEVAKHLGQVGAVVTDMLMPVMDGANTVRALRTIDPEIKVIAASAIGHAHALRVDNHTLNGVLAKPFRADTLLRVLREVLDD